MVTLALLFIIHAHIETLQCELADIDAYLLQAMSPYAWAHDLLQTIPGIDTIAAALIIIEIGDDMAHFASPARLACWAALSPGNNESAGKRKSGRTRHGNNVIRFILCECANAAHDQKHSCGQVPQPDGAQVAQEGNRGHRTQDDPIDLHSAHAPSALYRPGHRLRGP